MRLRQRIVQTIQTDTGLCVLLTLLAGGTRWFFFQGRNAVPFEIQDEITLVWALKDFLTGHWYGITGPIHRFVASYAFLPFFGLYFIYHWLIGAVSGFAGVIESFLLQTAHATTSISVWVWVPRLVSLLSLVLSVPLQFVLTKRITGSKPVAFLASVFMVFGFTHLYSSFFGLVDGLGFLAFQLALLGLMAYVRRRSVRTTIILSTLLACTLSVQLLNTVVLLLSGLLYLIAVRTKRFAFDLGSVGKEILILAGGTVTAVIIINPLTYLATSNIVREFFYGVGEWAPRSSWNPVVHLAHIARLVFGEILGWESAMLVSLAILMLAVRRGQANGSYYFLVVPMLCSVVGIAYLAELTYETNLLVLYIPASILSAWLVVDLLQSISLETPAGTNVLRIWLGLLVLTFALAGPIQDWFSLYRMALAESTRSSARNWIQDNLPAGSKIYIAPYTYTAPLISSVAQLQREFPFSELARWRVESDTGRALSPDYYLITDLQLAVDQGIVPEYYVRTAFADLRETCSWQRVWAMLLCPYNPLRGSFPYFSQINQMPVDPPDSEMVLLREFNPICAQSVGRTVYINYRTNVLRNNVRYLCRFGPIIQLYRLSGTFESA